MSSGVKYCGGCQEQKPHSAFSLHRNRSDGLAIQCKDCYRAYYLKRKQDPAFVQHKRDMRAAWRGKNAAKARADEKARAAADPDKKRRERRESYARHPEAAKANVRKWCKANPEKYKAYMQARRAREIGAGGRFTGDDIKEIFAAQRGRCAVCTAKLLSRYHIDHIAALSRGGTNHRRNLQILCVSCNTSKSNRDPIEFMRSRGRLL